MARKLNHGIKFPSPNMLGKINLTSPTCADDMTSMALNKISLQRQLNIVYQYSCKWRYLYNPTKCMVIIFGKDTTKHEPLGNDVFELVNGDEYEGTMLSPHNRVVSGYTKKRVNDGKRPGHAIMAIGSRNAQLTPITGSKLYWAVCIPKVTYGSEVMDLKRETMASMEAYDAEIANTIHRLPNHAAMGDVLL